MSFSSVLQKRYSFCLLGLTVGVSGILDSLTVERTNKLRGKNGIVSHEEKLSSFDNEFVKLYSQKALI